ncbi:MAG TPA: hypothetical protein VH277_11190 [Gemmatimonadaceae bacterium]|nr:hypothetical protein [Gemmatimonadaceae bacterium]
MHSHISIRAFGALGIAFAAYVCYACGRKSALNAGEDKEAAGRLALVDGHRINSDDEWRAMLDTVRTSDGPDSIARVRSLRSFAATARAQAAETNAVAARNLTNAADELDSIASGVERGNDYPEQRLDSTLARLEQGESLDRLARATDAWSRRNLAEAGQQLESSADQFELAANDARATLDSRSSRASADAHSVAARLADGEIVSTDEFLRTVTALDVAVRRVYSAR